MRWGLVRRAATDGADGRGLPAFVEREFREFPGCGVLARGFARVRGGDCAFERLAALIPRPRINLIVYHGVLAPNAGWCAQMVAYGRGEAGAETGASGTDGVPGSRTPRHWAWAALMRRVFEVDVLACPRCGGQRAPRKTVP